MNQITSITNVSTSRRWISENGTRYTVIGSMGDGVLFVRRSDGIEFYAVPCEKQYIVVKREAN